jgi:hypothetical protein
MTTNPEFERQSLRHVLATLAYRGTKTFRGASASFAQFQVAAGSRTPLHILAHMGDLIDWSLSMVRGNEKWNNATPQGWDTEVNRFCSALRELDVLLAGDGAIHCSLNRLFQGPIADALTHVGQLAQLRRLAGEPMKGENYFRAEIVSGRVDLNQAKPVREFD